MKNISKRLRDLVEARIENSLDYIRAADALMLEAAHVIETMAEYKGKPVAFRVHEEDVHGRPHWYCEASDYPSKVEAMIHGIKLTALYE